MKPKNCSDWLWDIWCTASLIGIWPRFIEPRLLSITRISLPVSQLPPDLVGLKILQFSDLHWSSSFSLNFARKMVSKINDLKPDLIVFTGDLLCRSQLEDPTLLASTLCSLRASLGCFAILGNHDYEQFVTVNAKGDYDIEKPSVSSNIGKGFKRLFRKTTLSRQVSLDAKRIHLHQPLIQLFRQTPFQLLHNASQLVPIKQSFINVCGLGEYTLGRLDLNKAFSDYDVRYPGLILVHNPDSAPTLVNYPGDIILSGHTHGGQINLPGIWKKLTYMENPHFKRGLKEIGGKWLYINRGIGSVMKFRWFSMPELTLITLKKG